MIREKNMYAEVYEILNILGSEYREKLPKNLFEYIASNRNVDYICNFDNENLSNQKIRIDTIEFISYLNLMYWCEDEIEKQRLVNIYQKNEDKYKESIEEKKFNNNIKSSVVNDVEKEVTIYKKETKLEKLLSRILKILHIK